MHLRLALALVVSLVIIGGASWSRFLNKPSVNNKELVTIENGSVGTYDQSFLQQFLERSVSTSSPQSPLTNTDLITRQMVADYIDLVSSGQATDSAVLSLTEKYVESIPTLANVNTVGIGKISVVANTKTNFQNYANTMTQIMNDYGQSIQLAAISNYSLSDPVSFASIFISAYKQATPRLQAISVPSDLVLAHLDLLNSFISSTISLETVAKTNSDPATAFASIIRFNENVTKEERLLSEIANILTANGI